MTNYNDGRWHGWNGGECPVHPETLVEIVTTEGSGEGPAVAFVWGEPDHLNNWIVAFRVIKPYREPRELWLQEGYMTGSWIVSTKCRPGAVLFREVIE